MRRWPLVGGVTALAAVLATVAVLTRDDDGGREVVVEGGSPVEERPALVPVDYHGARLLVPADWRVVEVEGTSVCEPPAAAPGLVLLGPTVDPGACPDQGAFPPTVWLEPLGDRPLEQGITVGVGGLVGGEATLGALPELDLQVGLTRPTGSGILDQVVATLRPSPVGELALSEVGSGVTRIVVEEVALQVLRDAAGHVAAFVDRVPVAGGRLRWCAGAGAFVAAEPPTAWDTAGGVVGGGIDRDLTRVPVRVEGDRVLVDFPLVELGRRRQGAPLPLLPATERCLASPVPAVPTTTTVPAPPPSGLIAFAREDGVWLVRPDGTGLRRVVDGRALTPAWSPDRRQLAYAVPGGDAGRIFVVDVDASDRPRALVSGRDPSWSPDGRQLAYTCSATVDGRSHAHVCVVGADGSGPRDLTPGDEAAEDPSWGSMGLLAFTALDPQGWRIDMMDGSGAGRRTIVQAGVGRTFETVREPAWSPDRTHLAFAGEVPGRYDFDIWMTTVDGPVAPLTSGEANDHRPAWSPDGRLLVVSRDPPGPADTAPLALAVLDLAGGEPVVVPGTEGAFWPAW